MAATDNEFLRELDGEAIRLETLQVVASRAGNT